MSLTRKGLADALRYVRERRSLTQEDFAEISSRTYLSSLERGQSSPTFEKIVLLCERLQVQPVTLIALAQCEKGILDLQPLLERVAFEVADLEGYGRVRT